MPRQGGGSAPCDAPEEHFWQVGRYGYDEAQIPLTDWTVLVPVLALVALVFSWGRELPGFAVVLVALCLAGAVLAAVHHAEVVAHRVGEPFGSLILAVAVTVIEVALIVTLMADGGDKSVSSPGTPSSPPS